MKHPLIACLSLLLSAAAGAQPRAAPSAPTPINLPAADALSGALGGRSAGGSDCLIEPSVLVNVGSPVDGVLKAVNADRGDSVSKGQLLAQLQSGVEAAAVSLSQARIEFGKRKTERNEALFLKQLISAQEKDEMETETRIHEEELKRDEENLKLRSIVSPINGVVVERKLVAGDLIRAEKSVVFKLAQLDPLNVEVVVPAEQFGSIRVGMMGRVSLALGGGTQPARVVVVDRLIDAASGTFGVRLQLPNPGYRIPAGSRCSVRFKA
ncbi:efflux RND transporter periplasmic adaptor subunit [Paucibacter sp. hw8]|uniref:Efflux RND transporter periplasmic adaptor subunit n=2 Tax=Roseateles albus TaxID=2987525 RepID=A0ABT5KGM2_9BURK|nr:efflux RND transporter periplasmic adaptor subunit [Roseateles albus]